MPEIGPESIRRPQDDRPAETRRADHASIDRLAADLLPALVAKLGATGLGEIEVREGGWRVRLRRPADGGGSARRSTDRPSRAQPGHAGHGHAPAALEGHRSARAAAPSTNGTEAGTGSGAGHLPGAGPARGAADERRRVVATSPAVGIYHPRPEVSAGTRVRAGDRLAVVDVLGVSQEVVAPGDGVVGASFAEPGEAVEYGQELLAVELSPAPASQGPG